MGTVPAHGSVHLQRKLLSLYLDVPPSGDKLSFYLLDLDRNQEEKGRWGERERKKTYSITMLLAKFSLSRKDSQRFEPMSLYIATCTLPSVPPPASYKLPF